MDVIESAIKGYETEKMIDSMDNKVIKGLAVDIMNDRFGCKSDGKPFRRSDLTMREARNVLYQAVMLHGYQL